MIPLTVHAQPTRAEIILARLALCVHTPFLLASLLAGAVVPLLFWAVGVGTRGSPVLFLVPPVMGLLMPLGFVFSGLASLEVRELTGEGEQVTLSEAGIGIVAPQAAGTLAWSAARGAWETEHLFVLWAGSLHVLPKRGLESLETVERVRALLRRGMGSKAHLR